MDIIYWDLFYKLFITVCIMYLFQPITDIQFEAPLSTLIWQSSLTPWAIGENILDTNTGKQLSYSPTDV